MYPNTGAALAKFANLVPNQAPLIQGRILRVINRAILAGTEVNDIERQAILAVARGISGAGGSTCRDAQILIRLLSPAEPPVLPVSAACDSRTQWSEPAWRKTRQEFRELESIRALRDFAMRGGTPSELQARLSALEDMERLSFQEKRVVEIAVKKALKKLGQGSLKCCDTDCTRPARLRLLERPYTSEGIFVFEHTLKPRHHGSFSGVPDLKLFQKDQN